MRHRSDHGGDKIKAYVISVISVAVIGSFISILTPDGEGGGIKKHVNLIIGLAVILVCLSPFVNALDFLSNLDFDAYLPDNSADREEYESIFQSSYESAEIYNLKSGIKSALHDKFGIAEEECEVSVTTVRVSDGGYELRRVFVVLYGSAIWKDSGAIEDYLYSLLGCEIVTAVG